MNKKLWIIGAVCVGLFGIYFISNKHNLASVEDSSDNADKSTQQAHRQYERTSLVEVKQALTGSALDRTPKKTGDDAFNSALLGQPGPVTNPFHTTEDNTFYESALGDKNSRPQENPSENNKPIINLTVEQQLQTIIYAWELKQNSPVSYSLNLNQLFEDPDGDLLTTQIWLENANGLRVLNQGQMMVQGAPEEIKTTTYLAVAARDDYHGNSDHAWVTTRFELPVITPDQNDTEHPLVGDVVYRLETTQNLAGIAYAYEVVYCEAFQFEGGEVSYAASHNKRQCPEKGDLKKVGKYKISDDSLIVYVQGVRQIWTIKKEYPSQVHEDTRNYFTTVFDGKQFESYTMQKNKQSMEKRINAPTGRYLHQISFFDYLLPLPSGGYLVAEVGNYIYHYGTQVIGPHGESIESDFNLHTYGPNLYCSDVAIWYHSHVIAGQGDYQIDIISDPNPDDPTYQIDCHEFISTPATGQQSLSFDLNYSPYDELLDGEVYSYILRPKPELADRVEEFKINMIYHAPVLSDTQ
ncbi:MULTISPECIES: hypothetical protein [Vibrio]|uniref:hypothetical protein n=1 Tax=Vibrio TaxID=662 RepID=UPI0021600CA8|nr:MULTISPECIES: hypothetical protein [Vibrio]EIC9813562.1 hypothetical protein [Vibrio alginolyticus]EII5415050.1 hypothetical protein [Vibrio alginolyticus]ELU8567614.1 hypothetical protein [Vibrio alginolyticus]MCS0235335.1 hypothetical protein [Vibrio alginolyticus]MCS0274846.1 hypothetical protein [Vibrio alginolyticus]